MIKNQWCNYTVINGLKLLNLSHFKPFSSKIRNTYMFCSFSEKMAVIFTIISNIVVTAGVPINKKESDLLIKGIFEL